MLGKTGAAALFKRLVLSFLALIVGSFFGFNTLSFRDFLRLTATRRLYNEPLPTFTLSGYFETFVFMSVIATIGWIPAAPLLIMDRTATLFRHASRLLALVYGSVFALLTMGMFLGILRLKGSLGAEGPSQYFCFAGFVGMAAGLVYRSLLLRFTARAAV